jgi:hypothetical protein
VVQAADGGIVPPQGQSSPADAGGADALARALHWPAATSNEWLAVSATLLGGAGRMRCLGPSVSVLHLRQSEAPDSPGSADAAEARLRELALAEALAEADEEEAAELRAAAEEEAAEQGGQPAHHLAGAFHLTPPPPTLASEPAVAAARTRFEMVADRLGLSGAAAISGFMQVETGEVVVADVCTTPDLSPGALIFQQVGAACGWVRRALLAGAGALCCTSACWPAASAGCPAHGGRCSVSHPPRPSHRLQAAACDPPLSPAAVLQELVRVALTQPLEERDELQVGVDGWVDGAGGEVNRRHRHGSADQLARHPPACTTRG